MANARTAHRGVDEGDIRGAAAAAPRATIGAAALETLQAQDLQCVVRDTAAALSCTVAVSLPALKLTAQWPPAATDADALRSVERYALALMADAATPRPPELPHVVPVRAGAELLGAAAAVSTGCICSDTDGWLEAAAAAVAAAVAALMRHTAGESSAHAKRSLLLMFEEREQVDPDALLTAAERLGYDFSAGGFAVGVMLERGSSVDVNLFNDAGLFAEVAQGRLMGLVPRRPGDGQEQAARSLASLRESVAVGNVILSSAPAGGAQLQRALLESAILTELLADDRAQLTGQDDTYRLLVGILIREPDELYALHARTVAALEAYDAAHDTELKHTLEQFLAHHGSTTETAEAMSLHRHTVGYRLARVHDVSGLSPYESEGRERLSLGLKAKRILLAEERRLARLGRALDGAARASGPGGPATTQ